MPVDAAREKLRHAARVVVKIGSSALCTDGQFDPSRAAAIADEIVKSQREVVCVSSGAIAAGVSILGLKKRPSDTSTLQAVAALGQPKLMNAYSDAFSKHDTPCAQVLLTRSDFTHRASYVNALHTFSKLFEIGAVAIVNENDSVATEEIRYGENDILAALVANLLTADALILLSDVEGLLDRDGQVISRVESVTEEISAIAGKSVSAFGSGGMATKIQAARVAATCGITAVITKATPGALTAVLDGQTLGTIFHPALTRMRGRKTWIAFAAQVTGAIEVDKGAHAALVSGGKSLLRVGVISSTGDFEVGDAVELHHGGQVFARGIARVSASQLADSTHAEKTVVHRDQLVIL